MAKSLELHRLPIDVTTSPFDSPQKSGRGGAVWLTAVDDDVPAEGDDVRAAAAAAV